MNATPADLAITALTAKGNSYTVVVYSDPFPGKVGTDRIKETCGKCGGTGVVNWGNVTFVAQGREDRHCFQCLGKGYTTVKVSSRRATARRQAESATLHNAEAADFAAEAPAREAAKLEADHEAALREEARREAKPKGFLGEPGARLRNLAAQVTLIRSFESANYLTGQPELKFLVKFAVAGSVAVWFTGNPGSLEEGQAVSLTGTVKNHSTREGEDQTVLTRCVTK